MGTRSMRHTRNWKKISSDVMTTASNGNGKRLAVSVVHVIFFIIITDLTSQ